MQEHWSIEDYKKYQEKRILTVAHGQSKGSNHNLEISPTLDTKFSNNWRGVILEPKILIKNATKQGYLEAVEGDGINLAYPNSTSRRGRVGKQVSQTLQCNGSMGIVTQEMRIRKLTPLECWRLMRFF